MGRVREGLRGMGREMRKNKGSFAVYVVLRLIVLACAVGSLAFDNYEAFFLCLLTLVLFLVPTFIEVNFSISIPETLEVVHRAVHLRGRDTGGAAPLLHHLPVLGCAAAYVQRVSGCRYRPCLVSILNRSDRIAFSLSPFFCVVVAFCFSMTIGVLWEFFEFGMDEMFGLDMQKDTVMTGISSTLLDPSGSQHPQRIDRIESVEVNGQELGVGGYLDIGLRDTMGDLFVNFVGALAFSVIGYRYLKARARAGSCDVSCPPPHARRCRNFDYLTTYGMMRPM